MLGYFQQVYEDHVFFERLFPKTQNSWYKYCVGVEEEKEAFLFLPRCYKHWVFPGIISRTFWHFLEMVYRARLLSAIWLREIFVCWVWVVLAPGNTQASFQMNISSAQICRPELRLYFTTSPTWYVFPAFLIGWTPTIGCTFSIAPWNMAKGSVSTLSVSLLDIFLPQQKLPQQQRLT